MFILCVVGVGKTSLVVRNMGGVFSENVSPTIGASFFSLQMYDEYNISIINNYFYTCNIYITYFVYIVSFSSCCFVVPLFSDTSCEFLLFYDFIVFICLFLLDTHSLFLSLFTHLSSCLHHFLFDHY